MFIPVNEPLLKGNELKYVTQCIETGWISSEGPFVKEFEDKFSARAGRKYGIAVCNGTAALDASVAALGLTEGDEVIMPAFTIISCIVELVRRGVKPVLVDSDALTWNMDVSQIADKITARTKAIMVVHTYGLPVDMNPVLEIAEKNNLFVMEDSAEAHGQTYYGKPCGSFGDISTFSFYPNKHVTTGEGGMIVTDNEELARKCKSLRNLCFIPEKRFVHYELGWNLRMTNIQAAIGLAQLERLDDFIAIKKEMGAFYQTQLSCLKGKIQLPSTNTCYAENNYWVMGMVLKETVPFNAEAAMKKLAAEGIGSRPFFYPMHLQPVLNKMGLFKGERYPVSENLAERGFYIPSGLGMTETQRMIVVEKVIEVLR